MKIYGDKIHGITLPAFAIAFPLLDDTSKHLVHDDVLIDEVVGGSSRATQCDDVQEHETCGLVRSMSGISKRDEAYTGYPSRRKCSQMVPTLPVDHQRTICTPHAPVDTILQASTMDSPPTRSKVRGYNS